MRLVALAIVMAAACTEPEDRETVVHDAGESLAASCAPNERYVTNVCTSLGPADGCASVGDVCIALCGDRQTFTTTGELRLLSPWGVAPDGYCVAEVP